jgi:hypothetical protein
VERQDFEFEEFMVAEAIGWALHGSNLAIGGFRGTGRNEVIIVG